MARQSNLLRETVSIRLDPELWKEAKIYAIKNDISVAELVEEALKKEITKK
jgi:predicted HicB family RNase H-like nuclease